MQSHLICLGVVCLFLPIFVEARSKRQVSFGFGFGDAIRGGINSFLSGSLANPVRNPNHRHSHEMINRFPLVNHHHSSGFSQQACPGNTGCQHGCRFRRGQIRCFCNEGYFLNDDFTTCSDIDECNFGDGFNRACEDKCENAVGSFKCSCSLGELLEDGRSCGVPTASCAANNGGCAQLCEQNFEGDVFCGCNNGYELGPDQKSCLDIDECATGIHNCGNQACSNTPGSFNCAAAFQSPATCDVENGGCDQRCRMNNKGIVICACRKGFELQPDGKKCLDIDECALGQHACPIRCLNTPGAFQCTNAEGLAGCAAENGGCDQRCRDTKNGVVCICRKGFELQPDGKACLDIDECKTGTHNCPEICVNKPGTFQCTTAEKLAGCATNNGGCPQGCRDTKNGPKCTCFKGFRLQPDGKTCLLIEQTVNPCQKANGGCSDICTNNKGTPVCTCKPGFTLVLGHQCQQNVPEPTVTAAPVAPVAPVPVRPAQLQQGCGVNTKKSLYRRIVGGKPADPKDWPWMAALIRVGASQQFCGGTLITDRHVLTAAHCVISFKPADIKIRLGEYDFDKKDENSPTDFNVADIRMHQGYDQTTQENDIAIVKVDRPSTFSEFIWPACLPPPNDEFEDQLGYVTGWGTIHFGGPTSSVLQEVVIPVWKQDKCVNAYPANKVAPTMMCAGQPAGGQDSCQGDSGGPFLIQVFPETRWYVAGVVSWGIECASPNRPGVYTRVNKYLDWIKENAIF